MNAGELAKVLESIVEMAGHQPVILEGKGELTDWRGEVRDGQRVLVLYAAEAPHWRPAVNGGGKFPWFLIWSDESVPVSERYHYNGKGNLVRFASHETAQRAADKLNAQVQS
jgi:hypothetical protein